MTSERVIGSYFVIAGLYTLAAALIWGVNTLFLLAAGLDIFGVFIANAAFTAGMVVLRDITVLRFTSGSLRIVVTSVEPITHTGVGRFGSIKWQNSAHRDAIQLNRKSQSQISGTRTKRRFSLKDVVCQRNTPGNVPLQTPRSEKRRTHDGILSDSSNSIMRRR
jgi:hypothetical protein